MHSSTRPRTATGVKRPIDRFALLEGLKASAHNELAGRGAVATVGGIRPVVASTASDSRPWRLPPFRARGEELAIPGISLELAINDSQAQGCRRP